MGKFWEWHKKIFNDKTPILTVKYRNDGMGNKAFGMKMGGSYFTSWEMVNEIEHKPIRKINSRRFNKSEELDVIEPELLN